MSKLLAIIIVIICGIGLYLFINYVISNEEPEERNSVLPIFQDHPEHKKIPNISF